MVYNFLGCIDAFSKYGTFTIGYGALGETSVVGCTYSTYAKDICTFSQVYKKFQQLLWK
jgi:hypothetical protein